MGMSSARKANFVKGVLFITIWCMAHSPLSLCRSPIRYHTYYTSSNDDVRFDLLQCSQWGSSLRSLLRATGVHREYTRRNFTKVFWF